MPPPLCAPLSPCAASFVVHTRIKCACVRVLLLWDAVGHGWPGAVPHHHQQLLPWRPWHHHCAWRPRGCVPLLGPPVGVCGALFCVLIGPASACVLFQVYDITDRDSYDNVTQWLNEIERWVPSCIHTTPSTLAVLSWPRSHCPPPHVPINLPRHSHVRVRVPLLPFFPPPSSSTSQLRLPQREQAPGRQQVRPGGQACCGLRRGQGGGLAAAVLRNGTQPPSFPSLAPCAQRSMSSSPAHGSVFLPPPLPSSPLRGCRRLLMSVAFPSWRPVQRLPPTLSAHS
jgi:hypothetical protein